jgi:hypothetical protein
MKRTGNKAKPERRNRIAAPDCVSKDYSQLGTGKTLQGEFEN